MVFVTNGGGRLLRLGTPFCPPRCACGRRPTWLACSKTDGDAAEMAIKQMAALGQRDAALESPDGLIPSHKLIKWANGMTKRERFVYVDETACIGCTHCATTATNTFFMEPDYGRARAFYQDGDTDEVIAEAIDTCPVNCIYYVPYDDLRVLEFEREKQVINPKARLVSAVGSTLSSKAVTMQDLRQRCENCPQRGCADCPLYGVGNNPVYKERLAQREAKRREKRRETRRTTL